MDWRGFPPMSMAAARPVSCPSCCRANRSKSHVIESRPGSLARRLERVVARVAGASRAGVPLLRTMRRLPLPAHRLHGSARLQGGDSARNPATHRQVQAGARHCGTSVAEPWNYRNRTRMHVRHEPEFALGYFARPRTTCCRWKPAPSVPPLIQPGDRCGVGAWPCRQSPASLHGVQFFADHARRRRCWSRSMCALGVTRPQDCNAFARRFAARN